MIEVKGGYVPVRRGVMAGAEQRHRQGWRWIGGRWVVPADLPECQAAGLVEPWMVTGVQPTVGGMDINLGYLGEHGHLCTEDAYNLHSAMMVEACGTSDPDAIVADWNRRARRRRGGAARWASMCGS